MSCDSSSPQVIDIPAPGTATDTSPLITAVPTFCPPAAGSGTLKVTLERTGDDKPVRVALCRGSTIVASTIVDPPLDEDQTVTLNLTSDQIASLRDGICNNSQVTVEVDVMVQVACCPNPVPQSLAVTFKNAVPSDPDCPGLEGASIPITFDSTTSQWTGSSDLCGGTYNAAFWCNPSLGAFVLSLTVSGTGCFTPLTGQSLALTCDPFSSTHGPLANGTPPSCTCCTGGRHGLYAVVI